MTHVRTECPHGGLISSCRCPLTEGVETEIRVTERCPFGCGEEPTELTAEDDNYDPSDLLSIRRYLSRDLADTMPEAQRKRLQALIFRHGYGPR